MRRPLRLALFALLVLALAVSWQLAQQRAGVRRALFAEIQPVALSNCDLQRFGEAHDGGYLMCANLLRNGSALYSYGIAGYDGWGCSLSQRLHSTVHQYDCFDPARPACGTGQAQFHDECVAGQPRRDGNRVFDTVDAHIRRNGDAERPIVMKIDVEGAEWDTLPALAPQTLQQIDQLAVEFHGVNRQQYVDVLRHLKRTFVVAHLHFNNYSCGSGAAPFPSTVFEVLLVNRRLAQTTGTAPARPHPLDAPNNPQTPDCQDARPVPGGAESLLHFWMDVARIVRTRVVNAFG
jgi:hypothetical protein